MKTKKIIRAVLQAVGGAVIGGLIIVLGWCYVVRPLQYRVEFWLEPFNSAVWKAEKPTGGIRYTERRCMIRDLSRHYLKKGMERAEVIAILGEPRGLYGPKTMDYWLGYPRWWLTMDHDILEITLNDAGKVIGWEVRNT
jgi:hypothetical protein